MNSILVAQFLVDSRDQSVKLLMTIEQTDEFNNPVSPTPVKGKRPAHSMSVKFGNVLCCAAFIVLFCVVLYVVSVVLCCVVCCVTCMLNRNVFC